MQLLSTLPLCVLLRSVMTTHGGYVFKMVGDAIYTAFAVAAAVASQQAVAAEQVIDEAFKIGDEADKQ